MEIRADVVDTSANVQVSYEEPNFTGQTDVMTPELINVDMTNGDADSLRMQGGYVAFGLNQTLDANLAAQAAPPNVDAAVTASHRLRTGWAEIRPKCSPTNWRRATSSTARN